MNTHLISMTYKFLLKYAARFDEWFVASCLIVISIHICTLFTLKGRALLNRSTLRVLGHGGSGIRLETEAIYA